MGAVVDSVRQAGVISRCIWRVDWRAGGWWKKLSVLNGTADGAAAMGGAVKPCACGAPLRGCEA